MEESRGDLVQVARGGIAVAHCVSADFKIGAGVAKQLDAAFGIRQELMETVPQERRIVGSVIELHRAEASYVFNLITKRTYKDKPTYEDFERAVCTLRDACENRGLREVAVPRMGCGIDRLEWPRVKEILRRAFEGSGVSLTVYTL